MSCNLTFGGSGLPFIDKGAKKYVILTETQLMTILCHGLSPHGVTASGGIYGGKNSDNRGKGVALGANSVVQPESEYDSIDAVQIGEGRNKDDKTVKFYHWLLLDKYGIIPKERLPELDIPDVIVKPTSVERKTDIVSKSVSVVNPNYGKFLIDTTNNHVDMVLPKASEVEGLGFYFRLFKQGTDGFAFKVERSHTDIIHIGKHPEQGGYEEWVGITCDKVGTWFYLVACKGAYYLMSELNIMDLNNVV